MGELAWLERRRRATKCKIHGIYFDPALTAGCILCRKEGRHRQYRGPQLVVLLLALLGIAVALFRMFGPAPTAPLVEADLGPPNEPVVAAPGPSAERLDPEPLRSAIEALEATLFMPRSDQLAVIGVAISGASAQLSANLRALGSAPAVEVATELEVLLGSSADAGFNLKQLGQERQDWLLIRSRHFQPARWFVRPAGLAQTVDRATVVAYRESADQLQALIDEGTALVGSQATPEQAASWRRRIAELAQQMPLRPGPEADARLLVVVQDLEQTLGRLRALAPEPLPEATAGAQFVELARLAQETRRALDDLLL